MSLLNILAPREAGALWVGVLVTLLVFADFRRPLSRRNAYLAGLLAMAPPLLKILNWSDDRRYVVFTVIFIVTFLYACWGLWLSRRDHPALSWTPRLSRRVLLALFAALLAMNVTVTFGRPPDDAGYYTNLGTQRWLETGRLPYADSLLKGPDSPAYGAAATYGPLLYAAHVPALVAFAGGAENPADADPMSDDYRRPPNFTTQLTSFSFYLLLLAALFGSVRRTAGVDVALGVVILFAASPYVIGLGSNELVISGLRFVSHIAPVAATLLALYFLKRPALSGGCLAAGTGLLFYPAFFLPAFLGWYGARKTDGLRFLGGFAAVGLAVSVMVMVFTPVPEGESILRTVLESTVQHQEGFGARQYGASDFSFWGTHPKLADFWQRPLFGPTSLFKPTFLLFSLFAAGTYFLARGRSVIQLAALLAAVAAAIQLWKTHAGGTYVEWYLPFLMIAIFGGSSVPAETKSGSAGPGSDEP